jgi:hypothetical protein
MKDEHGYFNRETCQRREISEGGALRGPNFNRKERIKTAYFRLSALMSED